MPPFISNGATLILGVLLVLAIAYRYYSAFLAAKVVALDPTRPTPAHTQGDGQNYHPTNKWVLFGHHFAAISGAGPLIGPVLAAQFGYLPGLLWILIGVCLAGAVQDFVVLALSIRRQGKSLAQIAYSDIGPASGTAATIGILFVLVIALAGLGKVVTKALGGETVTYDAGTELVSPQGGSIQTLGSSGSVYNYRVPKGSTIHYPNHVVTEVKSSFILSAQAPNGDALDIEDPRVPPGTQLLVSSSLVTRENPPVTYKRGTLFLASTEKPIQSEGMLNNVYGYTLPAGTRIIAPSGDETLVDKEFELSVRAAPIGNPSVQNVNQLEIPYGLVAVSEGPAAVFYPPETVFIAPNSIAPAPNPPTQGNRPNGTAPGASAGTRAATTNLIHFNGESNNLYTYTLPKGTRIIDSQQNASVANAAMTLDIKPADIQLTKSPGYKIVVPKNPAGFLAFQEIPGSAWGTFTIALTVPIAFMIGIYLYRLRKNRVLEASIIGGLLTLVAVYLGGKMNDPQSMVYLYRDMFNLSEHQVGYAIVIYGFVASVLPVWMLLCPRDYLSSFLKIGTIAILIVGVIIAHPAIKTPAINTAFLSDGPVVHGAIFPFLFITIMCGAISGFHALVSSGTTPKMINNERDARAIGYGAMLIEGLVGIVALIAATSLPVAAYYDINTATKEIPAWQAQIQKVSAGDSAARLDEPLPDVGEHIQGRTGGAVTLAMGMAYVLNTAVVNVMGHPDKPPAWLGDMFKYMYHFFIMFEALFILTTIDTGTRVGRFLLQETLGKWVHPKLGKADWWPSAVLATAAISFGWWYFLDANAFGAIWAMFGVANQMLAVMALAVATAALAGSDKRRYVWVTLLPMIFVAITTTSAAIIKLVQYLRNPTGNNIISAVCVIAILLCTAIVVMGAFASAMKPAQRKLALAT